MEDQKNYDLKARLFQGYDPNTESKETGNLLSTARFAEDTDIQAEKFSDRIQNVIQSLKKSLSVFETSDIPGIEFSSTKIIQDISGKEAYSDHTGNNRSSEELNSSSVSSSIESYANQNFENTFSNYNSESENLIHRNLFKVENTGQPENSSQSPAVLDKETNEEITNPVVSPSLNAPQISVDPVLGDEGSSVLLTIHLLSDPNPAVITYITITGIPADAYLSAGIKNVDGSWTVLPSDLAGLTLTTSDNFNGDFSITVEAVSKYMNLEKLSQFSTQAVITPVADTPSLSVSPASGNEDTAIPLNILASSTDSGETVSITISGLPAGATLSAGHDNGNGSWTLTAAQLTGLTLTPSANYSGTLNLNVTATSTDGSSTATTAPVSLLVTIAAVADTPNLSASPASGNEDTAIPLNILASVADASEALSVTISGLPAGASLSAGTNNGDGSWTLTASQLTGLILTPPANYSGTLNLNVTATSTDGSSTATTTPVSLPVTIAGIATLPQLYTSDGSGIEDNAVPLNIQASLIDDDGSESLDIIISGVPSDFSLSAGIRKPDGNWSVSKDDLPGLTLLAAPDFNGDVALVVTAISSENGTTSVNTASLNVHISGIADSPYISSAPAHGSEGNPIDLAINASLSSINGSEILSIVIMNLPAGFSLSAGSPDINGNWQLTPAELQNLKLIPPADYSGSFDLAIHATATEGNTQAHSIDSLNVTIDPIADPALLSILPASGSEDMPVELDISAVLSDTDGSENLSIMISDIPAGASLSAGHDNGDGSWTLNPSQLIGLKLFPPLNFSGDFDLTVSAISMDGGHSSIVTASLPVSISPVADIPFISVQPASGTEATPIALAINSYLNDTDGSESLVIKISGIPSGAVLSAGHDNGDGSWTLIPEELTGLTLTTPPHWSGKIDLSVSSTATDGADSFTETVQLPVTVLGSVGLPHLNVAAASGNEDAAIDLSITASIDDASGSEILTITISGLPAGATLSAGHDNGNGSWTLNPTDLNDLKLLPPTDFNGIINLTVKATSVEGAETAETSSGLTVTIAAVADTPNLSVSPASGNEDTTIPLNILTSVADASEALSITISGLSAGASLSAGTNNGNGSWTLTAPQLTGLTLAPPANYSGTLNLNVTATSADGSITATTTPVSLPVTIAAVADTPNLSVSPASGNEDTAIPLNILASVADASEVLSITISDLPASATLSAGHDNGDGSWTLTVAQLIGLTLTPPANYSGTLNLNVTATSADGSSTATTTPVSLPVTIAAVADTPSLSVSPASGNEDTAIPLNILASSVDSGETVSITISGLPAGAMLSAGHDNGDGSWTLTAAQLTGLTLTPPANYSGALNLNVTATSTDGSSTATTTPVSLPVTIAAVADTPNLSVSPASGNEDAAIPLNILASVADASEALSITISGLPAGASLSAGTNSGNGSWTLTAAQLTGLTLTAPANYSGALNLNVTATSADGSSSNSVNHNLQISVHAVADAATLSVTSSSGNEDNQISLSISSALTDMDGSEKLSILISGVPNGAFLSAGLNNGNGSWTLTQTQLTNLKITPPVNWNGNINLNVAAISTENNGDHKTVSAPLTVSVSAVADTPLLSVQSANGQEDIAIPLSISAGLRDNDGSETLIVQITGVPAGAALSAGTNNGNGSWTLTAAQLTGLKLTPPANSDFDLNLSVTAIATDSNGQISTASSNLAVNISGVADIPVVSASNTSGAINTKVPVTITGGASPDSSETLTYLVSGVPDGFSLTQGTNNGNNSWTLKPADLTNLRLVSPYGFEGRVTLNVKSISHETDGDVAQSAASSFTVGIGNAAGGIHLNLGIGLGVLGINANAGVGIGINTGNLTNGLVVMEDSLMPLTDANLLLNLAAGISLITVSGLPANAGFSAGVNLNNGVWQLLPSQLTNLKLIVPPNSDEDFTLTFSTQVTVLMATVTLTLATTVVHVVGVADMPTLSVANATGLEDSLGIPISVTSALTDIDGSETLSFTIKDLPSGFIPQIGINNGDGTWSLTKAEISSLSIKPPPNWSGDATYTIIATSTEREGDSTIKTVTGNIHIDPVADAPLITSTFHTGIEDSALNLNLGISLSDKDGSEHISDIIISNLGTGFSLTGATNNGDGTWSVSCSNINNVKLIPPANWSGDTSFTVSATSQEGTSGPKSMSQVNFTAHFDAVADNPFLSVHDSSGIKNHPIDIDISTGLTDLDGSEHLSVLISNVPDHFIFSSGLNNGNGSWSFGETDLDDLKIIPNQNFTGDVHLSVDVFAEDTNHTVATSHADLIVHVTPDT